MSSQTHSVAVALQKAGITIPAVPKPAGAYVGAIRTGNLVVTSGQLPWVDGKLLHVGRIGAEVSEAEGKAWFAIMPPHQAANVVHLPQAPKA